MTKAINTNFKSVGNKYTVTLEKNNNNTVTFTLLNNYTNNQSQASSEYNIDTWNMLIHLYGLEETA